MVQVHQFHEDLPAVGAPHQRVLQPQRPPLEAFRHRLPQALPLGRIREALHRREEVGVNLGVDEIAVGQPLQTLDGRVRPAAEGRREEAHLVAG